MVYRDEDSFLKILGQITDQELASFGIGRDAYVQSHSEFYVLQRELDVILIDDEQLERNVEEENRLIKEIQKIQKRIETAESDLANRQQELEEVREIYQRRY